MKQDFSEMSPMVNSINLDEDKCKVKSFLSHQYRLREYFPLSVCKNVVNWIFILSVNNSSQNAWEDEEELGRVKSTCITFTPKTIQERDFQNNSFKPGTPNRFPFVFSCSILVGISPFLPFEDYLIRVFSKHCKFTISKYHHKDPVDITVVITAATNETSHTPCTYISHPPTTTASCIWHWNIIWGIGRNLNRFMHLTAWQ